MDQRIDRNYIYTLKYDIHKTFLSLITLFNCSLFSCVGFRKRLQQRHNVGGCCC